MGEDQSGDGLKECREDIREKGCKEERWDFDRRKRRNIRT